MRFIRIARVRRHFVFLIYCSSVRGKSANVYTVWHRFANTTERTICGTTIWCNSIIMTNDPTLLAAEARLSQAYANRDIDHLDFLISDDFSYAHQSGTTQDKMAHLEPFRSKEALSETLSYGASRVLYHDGVLAVVQSSNTLGKPENSVEIRNYTRIWRQSAGQWLFVAGGCQTQILTS